LLFQISGERFLCQELSPKPRERSPSSFRVSGTRIVSCEIEVWCNKLGGLLYSPNLEYVMLQLSPIVTSNHVCQSTLQL
jgi:hypothetical protein